MDRLYLPVLALSSLLDVLFFKLNDSYFPILYFYIIYIFLDRDIFCNI